MAEEEEAVVVEEEVPAVDLAEGDELAASPDDEEIAALEAQLAEGEDVGGEEEGAADAAEGAGEPEPNDEGMPPASPDEDGDEEGGVDEMPADLEASPLEDTGASPVPDEEEAETQEEMADAMEGSIRLKRLLTGEAEEGGAKKKLKTVDPEQIEFDKKVNQLLKKWGLSTDVMTRYMLSGLAMEELDDLIKTNYMPDRTQINRKTGEPKSPEDIITKHVVEFRERKNFPGGAALDAVSTFKYRWKLSQAEEKVLRGLGHKDLRYVLRCFEEGMKFDEIIAEAGNTFPDDTDVMTENAIPDAPGVSTIGRFERLELIDPLADCAVFGDANLTFAIRLAKHRKALGHVGRVIATTFEELDTLRERYPEIDQSIKTLEDHYAEVYHGVDCTRVAADPRFEGMEGSLGGVYYNFPHSGAIQGFFDGHPAVNWRHENLMRLFFRALRTFVKPGGTVKVSSNGSALGVRFSYIVGSALQNEFVHTETMPFTEWHLHRYGRSYGDKRDVAKRLHASANESYNAQRADKDMVYCFRYAPTGAVLPPQQIRLPPSLNQLQHCADGPFRRLPQVAQRKKLAEQLHKRFVTEVSGVHVGT